MDILTNFAERLKYLIGGISFDSFSQDIGVDISIVYRWCQGANRPSIDNLVKIAERLECSVDFLVGRSENDSGAKYKQCPPFYQTLSLIMKNQKISEYRLCKDTKISRSRFYDWKIGKRTPSLDNLLILADYFNCSIDYLIGRED